GRWGKWGSAVIIGGPAARTADEAGAFYAPGGCGSDSIPHMWSPPVSGNPGAGPRVPHIPGVPPGAPHIALWEGRAAGVHATIHPSVYMGLSTIAGGEVVSADTY